MTAGARFEDHVVMVTGAGRGIGRAIAERFGAEGATLVLLSLEAQELEATAADLGGRGYPTTALRVDVSEPEQVDGAVGRTMSDHGRIDVLANNAGIAWEEPFLEITDIHWARMIEVNLNGMFYVAQRVARTMALRGRGCIVNMSSTNGLAAETKYAHYNASKAGVVLLTRSMARELGGRGVRVNAVCPGYIATPMSESIDTPELMERYVREKIPLGRVGLPGDVAGVFAFLASEDAAFITGQTIVVDGGQLA
jgi:3-oxoacyl-[acyl-carrier protein] reductase